jgi:Zn-finger nucleic acid-binding protein
MKHCPRDATLMATNDVEGYRYFSCEKCSGHWIPGHAGRRALKGPLLPLLREQLGESAIQCPVCRKPLGIFRIEGCAVDVCRDCNGLWLDAGEILKLAALFPGSSAILASARGQASNAQWDPVLATADAIGQIVNLLFVSGP